MKSKAIKAGLILVMVFSSILYSQSTSTVSGILKSPQTKIQPTDVSMKAYILSLPDDTLFLKISDCTYNIVTGEWRVDHNRFKEKWSEGDILHVDITDKICGPVASIDVTLTNKRHIDAGVTQMLGSPDIDANPTSWNFGQSSVGSSQSKTIQIKNTGSG